jgi:hypothetical protein
MAHIEKRGANRWRARYRTPGGEERSRTFTRRIDAERFLESVTVDQVRGEWADPKLGRILFADWVAQWEQTVASDLRPTTRELNLGVARNYLSPGSEPGRSHASTPRMFRAWSPQTAKRASYQTPQSAAT